MYFHVMYVLGFDSNNLKDNKLTVVTIRLKQPPSVVYNKTSSTKNNACFYKMLNAFVTFLL